jgi:hypothetical protein
MSEGYFLCMLKPALQSLNGVTLSYAKLFLTLKAAINSFAELKYISISSPTDYVLAGAFPI